MTATRFASRVLMALFVASCLAAGNASFATDFTPTTFSDSNTPGSGSLRDAISQANTSSTDDRILLSAGTYSLTLAGAGEDNNQTGDLDIARPFGSQTLTIQAARADNA